MRLDQFYYIVIKKSDDSAAGQEKLNYCSKNIFILDQMEQRVVIAKSCWESSICSDAKKKSGSIKISINENHSVRLITVSWKQEKRRGISVWRRYQSSWSFPTKFNKPISSSSLNLHKSSNMYLNDLIYVVSGFSLYNFYLLCLRIMSFCDSLQLTSTGL